MEGEGGWSHVAGGHGVGARLPPSTPPHPQWIPSSRSTQVVASIGYFESFSKVVKEDVNLASLRLWRNSHGLWGLGCS